MTYNASAVSDFRVLGELGSLEPGTCAEGLPGIRQAGVDERLGHLRGGGIAGAKEEDSLFHSSIMALTRKVVISASLGMRPAETSFSLMTRPGVIMSLYFANSV